MSQVRRAGAEDRDVELAEEVGIPRRQDRAVGEFGGGGVARIEILNVAGDDARVLGVPRSPVVVAQGDVDRARVMARGVRASDAAVAELEQVAG